MLVSNLLFIIWGNIPCKKYVETLFLAVYKQMIMKVVYNINYYGLFKLKIAVIR